MNLIHALSGVLRVTPRTAAPHARPLATLVRSIATKAVTAKKAVKKASAEEPKVRRRKTKRTGPLTGGALKLQTEMLQVKPPLQSIIGPGPISRLHAPKEVWKYIKANSLQDETNRRMINCDEKLSVLAEGKERISMFELPKFVHSNLIKVEK